MSNEEPEATDTISKGDVIRLEFDGWVEDTGDMFDTTDEEKAKENEIFDEEADFSPIYVLVGAGKVFPGLEEALEGSEVGVENEIVLEPEEAAGQRDPNQIELHPKREFHKQDIEPRVGMEVTLNNKRGRITAVTAGRVRVDFNRPLAGNTLRYVYTVVEKIEDDLEKVKAIIEMNYEGSEDFGIVIEDDVCSLTLPDVCKYDQKWLMSKYQVVSDLRETFGNITIHFIEEYPKSEQEPEEELEELEEEGVEEEIEEEEERAPEELEPEEIPQEEIETEEASEED